MYRVTFFTHIAMAIMIYALFTYHWRAASIRRGGRGPYDDRFGPVCTAPFFARNLAQSLSLCYLDYIVYRPVRCVFRFIQVLD